MSHESAHLFYPLSYTKEEPCSFHNTYGSYIITYPNWDTFVQGNAKLEKKKNTGVAGIHLNCGQNIRI